MTTDHSILILLFISLSVLYYILLTSIYVALRNLKIPEAGRKQDKISIVIAARNESARIGSCLESLSKLDYPKDLLEIIIVDDNSDDPTADIVQRYCEHNPNWKLLIIRHKSLELKGKKNALQEGINNATGELIFTTDADCIVKNSWIKIMSRYFHEDVTMVIGFSPLIRGEGIIYRFLEFDTLFSAVVAAGSASLGYPYSSTGRNLAYRKSAYQESGGFSSLKKYRSGDDMHLTRRFRDKGIGRIRYCPDAHTFVETQPPGSVAQFFQQQIRKNSKILRSGFTAGFFSILLFLYHVLLYTIPVINSGDLFVWIVFVFLKFMSEFLVLFYTIRIFKQLQLKSFLLVFQLVYPLFIIFFSILGSFQKYRWKS